MRALIIVDVQVDFCPGGALPAASGEKVIPVINKLMNKFDIIIASRDWHPGKSKHFDKWPVHCVRNSHGAEFHPKLKIAKIQKEFLKGTENKDDGYSAFEATNTNLNEFLKENEVSELFISGIATEYCVKETAFDSLNYGFKTIVVEDAIAGVRLKASDEKDAKDDMRKAGIYFLKSADV